MSLPEHLQSKVEALFQAASVLDGVDGEMARATFRASLCQMTSHNDDCLTSRRES